MRKSCLGIVVGALFLAAPLDAAGIFINSTEVIATTNNGQAVSTRVRASSGWDMMLGRTDTSTAANSLRWDFNTNPERTTVINKDLQFVLEHRAGEGYVFSVINPIVSGSVTRVLAWGSFSPLVTADTQAALLNGYAPDLELNAIRLQSRATAGGETSGVILSSLSFMITSPGPHSSQGAFRNTTTTPSTPASSWSNLAALGSGFEDEAGYQSQWIFVDENLTGLDWTLAGIVRIVSTDGRQRNNVHLNITGYDLEAEFPMDVPEASTGVLLGAGLAVVGAVRLTRKPRSVQAGDDS